ncbi:unannotated protein [freshwater metagenome]|uniref:Unannotated protein n=1 Tax=freshwater metagenome TaxID=449393 RepID=A0A6J7F4Z4_9ZZZZ|nr:aldo/keto reductase [Actinomycetota bacterium]
MDGNVIPRHGLGTAPLGGLYDEVSEVDAAATVATAIDCGIRYFDTAPQYGHGLAETRLGAAMRSSSVARAELTISTKVGRVLVPGIDPNTIFHGIPAVRPVFDFSADGIRRALDESLTRLGTDHVDLALLHDPDEHEAEALATSMTTLVRLRDEGTIGAIGIGMNQVAMLTRFASRAADIGLDVVLVAGRWTLLDRTAGLPGGLLDTCASNGVQVIVGGVFNSGILAHPTADATYDYGAAPATLRETAHRMADICRTFSVPLATAAIHFPWRHRAVSSVIVGARSAAEVLANTTAIDTDIPEALWSELDTCRGTPTP